MKVTLSAAKPKFFSLVGYSWLVLSVLGLAGGILSLPALFQLDQIRTEMQKAFLAQGPAVLGLVDALLYWVGPVTWAQIFLSAWGTAAGWAFLNGRNWGRLSLSALNLLTGLGMTVFLVFIYRVIFRFYEAMNVELMVRAGVAPNIPLWTQVFLWGSGILLVLPLIWMGWYFHSAPVRNHFTRPPVTF